MKIKLLTLSLLLVFSANTQTFSWDEDHAHPKTTASTVGDSGLAHIYPDYYENSPTALGEIFHQNLMTAGHQKLPLGTIVKVTRMDNGLSTTVRINDRGAYCDDCIIDLSKMAAEQIDLLQIGHVVVKITVMGTSDFNPPPTSAMLATAEPARFTARGGDYTPPATTAAINYPEPAAYKAAAIQTRSLPPAHGDVTIIEFPISPFSVQLGSYAKYANAERHVLALRQKGFDNVFLLKEQRVNNNPLNRVIIAPFTSLTDAEAYVNDLREIHEMKALVFQTTLMELNNK